jgi:hypothetical protein
LDSESGTNGLTIEENLFIDGTEVLVLNGSADTVRSNIFSKTGVASIRTYGANTIITNNLLTESLLPAGSSGAVDIRTSGVGVKISNNLFIKGTTSTSFVRPSIYIATGSPEVYSNGFVGILYATNSGGSSFVTNNGFYNSTAYGLNPVEENPMFVEFDSDNGNLDIEAIDENQIDLTLASGSGWIDAGRTGTLYLDTDGSRSDIGIYGGPNPFDDGRGAPSVPVVIQFQVSPTTVSPTGTITIQATGRIGAGDN